MCISKSYNLLLSLFLCIPLTFFAESQDSLWARAAGGTMFDSGQAIDCDDEGNSFITGFFRGVITFGDLSLTSQDHADIFVAKYDVNGQLIWATRAGGISGDGATDIVTDAFGRSTVTGCFRRSASFGNTTLATGEKSDIFVSHE